MIVRLFYHRLLGSYDHLEEGHISDALVDMTGGVSEIIDLKSREYDSSDDMRSELLHLLTSEMANHSIMCASIVVSNFFIQFFFSLNVARLDLYTVKNNF